MIFLNNLKDLSTCPLKEQVAFSALVTNVKELPKSSAKPNTSSTYVRVYLRDMEDSVSFPLWNSSLADAQDAFKIDTAYEFICTLKDFNGPCIDSVVSYTEITDSEKLKLLKPHLFKSLSEENAAFIGSVISSLATSKYGPYIKALYGDGNDTTYTFDTSLFPDKVCLYSAFASINRHDNYAGGFINHVIGMLKLALFAKSKYLAGRSESTLKLDWQYILAAVLLHDVGKPLTYNNVNDHLIEFRSDCKLDHNLMGVALLSEIHSRIVPELQLPYEDLQNLLYIIKYHDDIDKIYRHRRAEDNVIALLDGMDSILASAAKL